MKDKEIKEPQPHFSCGKSDHKAMAFVPTWISFQSLVLSPQVYGVAACKCST